MTFRLYKKLTKCLKNKAHTNTAPEFAVINKKFASIIGNSLSLKLYSLYMIVISVRNRKHYQVGLVF